MATSATPSLTFGSPTKRVLTDDAHSAIYAARHMNTYANSLIPDDLAVRLQSVGSRVRKNVSEGYITQRPTFHSIYPPVPFNSPVKASSSNQATYAYSPTAQTMPAPQIFKTANEAIIEAMSSPSRVSTSSAPVLPLLRKRGRDECDDDDSLEDPVYRRLFTKQPINRVDADGDIGMGGDEDEEDEEELEVFLGHNNGLPSRHNRPIKPLRKNSPPMYIPVHSQPSEVPKARTVPSREDLNMVSPVLAAAVSDIAAHMRMTVEASNIERCPFPSLTADMFNQPF